MSIGTLLLLSFAGFGVPIGIISYMLYIAFIKKRRAFGSLDIFDDEVVLLKMHGATIEDRHKTKAALQSFLDRMQGEMGNIGEVRAVNITGGAITVAIYGESAEEMYAQLRKVLRHTSLSKNASIMLRYGPPGSRERRIHMAN